MAGNLNLRNHFFGLNKQEILIRHEQLINDGRAAGTTQVGPENVQDIMRVIDPENTQKGIGSSDIILGEDVRDILENDNFIVAEIIKNWGDAQGKGLKTFKLSTDPDQAVDDMGLINAPRVFVGNKQVIEHIIGQSQRNTDEAQALIDFAETQYIADEVLASQQWQDLSRAEKIFHIIARYAFLGQDNPHTRIIQLLFGDYNHQLDQAVEDEDDGGASKDGPPRQKRRKKGGGRKTRRKRKKKTKRRKTKRRRRKKRKTKRKTRKRKKRL